ncbi:MAG: histidinol dehydrogenase, partial [Candidatus Limnocylindria bacterium]
MGTTMNVPIGGPEAFRRRIARRHGAAGFDVAIAAARATLDAVRRRGDEAVLEHVRRFDRPHARRSELYAERRALERAARRCPPELRDAIGLAYRRIHAYHRKQRPREIRHRLGGFETLLVAEPLERVGGCVPRGGATSYPSTALMIGVPAQVAGVRELVLCSPMPPDGSLDPALAHAATLVGAVGIYRAGGAGAVGALAFGTRLLPPVTKIVGPGNIHTTAAKWLVSAQVGIDGLQGPSELLVVASADADPKRIVLDLEAQAEHGGGPFAALLSEDAGLLRAVARALGASRVPADAIGLYRTPSLADALELAISAAPEHLSLAGRRAERLAPR